jgi:YHS domain-containing protein
MTKDPVCGMTVNEKKAQTVTYGGRTYYFCSAACKTSFGRTPAKYAAK